MDQDTAIDDLDKINLYIICRAYKTLNGSIKAEPH